MDYPSDVLVQLGKAGRVWDGPAFRIVGLVVQIAWSYEHDQGKRFAELVSDDTIAATFKIDKCCTVEDMKAWDCVIDVGDTPWKREMIAKARTKYPEDDYNKFKHLRVYFGDIGTFEWLAADVRFRLDLPG